MIPCKKVFPKLSAVIKRLLTVLIIAAMPIGAWAETTFLPQIQTGFMESPDDNTCPQTQNELKAKMIIYHLMGVVKNVHPEVIEHYKKLALENPQLRIGFEEDQKKIIKHDNALRDCITKLSNQYGMTSKDVEELYNFNTIPEPYASKFSDQANRLRDGKPLDYTFINKISDKSKALHYVKLAIVLNNFDLITSFDSLAKSTNQFDRSIFSRAIENAKKIDEKLGEIKESLLQ